MSTGTREAGLRVTLTLGTASCLYALNLSYTLGQFYLRGAGDDPGWFAWLATHATAWPMPNPAVQGGNFLAIHMSPAFFVATALLAPLSGLPVAVRYSLFVSLWAPLLWLGLFLLLGRFAWLSVPWRCAVAVLLTLNGAMLSMLGFPHVEMLIPAFGLLAFALCLQARWLAGGVALALALSVREDAGLHLCLLAGAMAWASAADRPARRRLLVLACVCLAGSAAALTVQRLAVPGGGRQLGTVYLGRPLLADVSVAGIGRRLAYWATRRDYVMLPLAVLAVAGWRDRRMWAGVAVALPWLALSLVAVSAQAGDLWGYYCFPLVPVVLWPLLLGQTGPTPTRRLLAWQVGLGGLSTAAFVAVGVLPGTGGGGAHDRAPWAHLLPPSPGLIRRTEAALAAPAGWLFDYGAAGLAMGALAPWQFRDGLAFTEADIGRARGLMLLGDPPAFEQARLSALRKRFPACAPVAGTRLLACTAPTPG